MCECVWEFHQLTKVRRLSDTQWRGGTRSYLLLSDPLFHGCDDGGDTSDVNFILLECIIMFDMSYDTRRPAVGNDISDVSDNHTQRDAGAFFRFFLNSLFEVSITTSCCSPAFPSFQD